MNSLIKNRLQKQAGFSLVELMVGLVIGLLATLVIMQVFSTFEAQKRSTTGTADAQTNGSLGLYSIQREVQKAGFGIPMFDGDLTSPSVDNNSALKCISPTPLLTPALAVDHDHLPASLPIDVFPIVIGEGGVGASDTITVRYANPNAHANRGTNPIPTLVVTPVTGTELQVVNNLGCKFDDIAIYVQGTSCRSTRVTSTDAQLNANPEQIFLASTAGMVNSGRLTCIGEFYFEVGFDVVNNELRRSGVPVLSEIVDLQAQYGIAATANSNEITQWIDATALTNRNRIRAIRVAIVARNNQLEKTAVTAACSSLTLANPTGLCAWDATSASPAVASPAPAISLAAVGGANYRYRVYETIIPVRNLTFSGALL